MFYSYNPQSVDCWCEDESFKSVANLGAPLSVWSPNIYQLSQLVLKMEQIQP